MLKKNFSWAIFLLVITFTFSLNTLEIYAQFGGAAPNAGLGVAPAPAPVQQPAPVAPGPVAPDPALVPTPQPAPVVIDPVPVEEPDEPCAPEIIEEASVTPGGVNAAAVTTPACQVVKDAQRLGVVTTTIYNNCTYKQGGIDMQCTATIPTYQCAGSCSPNDRDRLHRKTGRADLGENRNDHGEGAPFR